MIDYIIFGIGVLCAFLVIYDVFTNKKNMKGWLKAVWTILALAFSVITAIIYFLIYKFVDA